MEKINETISNAKNAVKDLIKQAQEKQLEAEPGRTMTESFENRVNQVHGLIFFFFGSLYRRVFILLVDFTYTTTFVLSGFE